MEANNVGEQVFEKMTAAELKKFLKKHEMPINGKKDCLPRKRNLSASTTAFGPSTLRHAERVGHYD